MHNLIDVYHCFCLQILMKSISMIVATFWVEVGINLGQFEPTTCSLPQRPSHRFLHQNPISLRFIKISTKFLVGSLLCKFSVYQRFLAHPTSMRLIETWHANYVLCILHIDILLIYYSICDGIL